MKRLMLIIAALLLLSGCDPVPVEPAITTTLHPGIDILDRDATWVDAGCDLVVEDTSFPMTRVTAVDTTTDGETTVEYQAILNDELYHCYRVVKVIQMDAPTATLIPGVDTIVVGDTHIDMGVTVLDVPLESVVIDVDNPVDTTTVGTYIITYTITDGSFNETIVQRLVHVIENPN